MDDKRFDALTRSLAAGASRRSVLRWLLGGAGAVAGSAIAKQSVSAQITCPSPDGACAGGGGSIPNGCPCNNGAGICSDDFCVECVADDDCLTTQGAGLCNAQGVNLCECVAGSQGPICQLLPTTTTTAEPPCVVGVDCAGNPDCAVCENDECIPVNQGGSCNGGAGICSDVWCVECVADADCLRTQGSGLCNDQGVNLCECVAGSQGPLCQLLPTTTTTSAPTTTTSAPECTAAEFECGDDCCVTATEACCDIAGCCNGVCYGGAGRDFCCPTGEGGLYCPVLIGGECCASPAIEKCCGTSGCCAGQCFGTDDNSCCEASTAFVCAVDDSCCPNADNCCTVDGCCEGSCTSDGECCPSARAFACGGGCCDTATEKCCDNVCIPAGDCCGDGECEGDCETCNQGQCVSECGDFDECCRGECVDLGTCCGEFGEGCGLIINGTFPAAGNPQFDCCGGLVCCEGGRNGDDDDDDDDDDDRGMFCAECCNDWGCGDEQKCCGGECLNVDCCGDWDCGFCEFCDQGFCRPSGGSFGDTCGVLIFVAEGGSPQLDCCDGLVCCQGGDDDDDDDDDVADLDDFNGAFCAECCGDWDCPKGSECRHGYCQFQCSHDKDCHDGTCCCKSGHCSKHCCDVPDDDKKPHKPDIKEPDAPVGGVKIETLPSTGIGDDQTNAGWLGAAALGAAAAYIASKKLKDDAPEPEAAEE